MWTLEGKTALVTGGGKGIGRAIALSLSARGVRVVVTGHEEKALGETVGEIACSGGQGRHVVGDVRDPAHLAAAVERAVAVFGGLHIVIANAGPAGQVEVGADVARAQAILETNLIGAYCTFNVALARMKGPGRLLAIGGAPANVGAPGYAAYHASQAGILGLCRATALEVAARNVTCNAIVPGWVESAVGEACANATARSRAPVAPEEVAELVVFLCSAAADGISGQAISIGSGSSA